MRCVLQAVREDEVELLSVAVLRRIESPKIGDRHGTCRRNFPGSLLILSDDPLLSSTLGDIPTGF